MALNFDYIKGRVFVQHRTIFYSPNCSWAVDLPCQTTHAQDPFKQPRLNSSMFKQPIWWLGGCAWLSFIPLVPSFLFTPFKLLCYVYALHWRSWLFFHWFIWKVMFRSLLQDGWGRYHMLDGRRAAHCTARPLCQAPLRYLGKYSPKTFIISLWLHSQVSSNRQAYDLSRSGMVCYLDGTPLIYNCQDGNTCSQWWTRCFNLSSWLVQRTPSSGKLGLMASLPLLSGLLTPRPCKLDLYLSGQRKTTIMTPWNSSTKTTSHYSSSGPIRKNKLEQPHVVLS